MQSALYVVYAITDTHTSARSDALRAFRSLERAKTYADAHTQRTGQPCSVDWVDAEITRHGREVVDCRADLYCTGPGQVEGGGR